MRHTEIIAPIYIYIYISRTCALSVVQHAAFAWACLVVCLWRGPYGGETHGYSLRIPPQIFLWNIHPATPRTHSSPTPDIPNALPEVLLMLLLLEVSYKRNTFKGLLLKASSLVAISCSIADHHTYTLYTIDSLLLSFSVTSVIQCYSVWIPSREL